VSLVTPVKITEETKLEKVSTLGLDSPSQSSLQNEHEVESALDVEPLDTPGVPMDYSKDDLGSGNKGKKFHNRKSTSRQSITK
jgi:hypothetical protein